MQSPQEWKAVIVRNCGSIHQFDDRTTIQVMLARTKEERAKIANFIDLSQGFPGVMTPETIQGLKDQDAELEGIQHELEDWESKNAPWDDCKVAFSIDNADAFDQWWDDPKHAEDLPHGWSVVEIDSSGARYVVVFQIEGMPTKADGQKVKKFLNRFRD